MFSRPSISMGLKVTKVMTVTERNPSMKWVGVLLDDNGNEVALYGDPQDVADQLEQIVTALRTVAA
jgi:alkanesulfonate monooxygenase SsuD/methylene tetrahydromethanopterin reductase-like flavin-dependent oxidoreductase (luciferase family)